MTEKSERIRSHPGEKTVIWIEGIDGYSDVKTSVAETERNGPFRSRKL